MSFRCISSIASGNKHMQITVGVGRSVLLEVIVSLSSSLLLLDNNAEELVEDYLTNVSNTSQTSEWNTFICLFDDVMSLLTFSLLKTIN